MTDKEMAIKIAEKVKEAGGTTYYVGGYVRDLVIGRKNKDIDIEVHNITPDQLKSILEDLGTVKTQGASFGVYNLIGYDIDIAQPRTESTTGRGHKDFEVYVDPFIGPKKAAMRRDFTMNAIMQDVLTGEIIDPFNGKQDIERGFIRHVNSETFVEDPLRVFRAAQFASRFQFHLAEETIDLIKQMDVSELSKERVYEEMKKALLKSDYPSIFFETLRLTDQLNDWFPEVKALINAPQNPEYHPEGDAWNHTMLALDNAAYYKSETSNQEFFMVAALCHDFGKPESTTISDTGKIQNIGHEDLGVPIAETFLKRLNNNKDLQKYVKDIVANHMKPHEAFRNESKIKSTNHMFDSIVNKRDICFFAIVDSLSKGDVALEQENYERLGDKIDFLFERLNIYEARATEPMVTGSDLIQMGMKPSEEFESILKQARKMHFSGVDKPAVLKDIVAKNRDKIDTKAAADLIDATSEKLILLETENDIDDINDIEDR